MKWFKNQLICLIVGMFLFTGLAWASHLGGPLYVGTSDSQVQVVDNSGNLFQTGTQITATAAELNALDGITANVTELNQYAITVDMTDISAANSVWVVAPHAGNIAAIYSVINGVIATVDATITAEIGGTLVTDSSITIAYTGSAAGVIDSSTPSAANTVTAGQAIEIISDGGSTNVVRATFTILITR